MICEEAMVLMSAKLDAALSPAEEEALSAHLAVCPACNALMTTLRGLDEQVATLQEPAPEGLKKGVLYRIDQATGKAKPARRGWFGPGTALGAVAAVLVLLVGLNVIPLGGSKATSSMQDQNDYAVSGNYASKNEEYEPAYEAVNGAVGTQAAEAPQDSRKGVLHAPESATTYYRNPSQYNNSSDHAQPRLVTQTDEAACTALSKTEGAAVLLYTEFTPESLFALLEAEEPKLYALVAGLEPESKNGLRCYKTDCGTALAIQEWLLAQLPHDAAAEPGADGTESKLSVSLEALDPGSTSLYRIITWPIKERSVNWPEVWPDDWADSLRSEENWRLFFPSEDYVPNAEKAAYLAFPEN